jgi:hypothetical protein
LEQVGELLGIRGNAIVTMDRRIRDSFIRDSDMVAGSRSRRGRLMMESGSMDFMEVKVRKK